MSLKEYVEHARARHGPLRAPLDALLSARRRFREDDSRARVSMANWALGVQFYDDALDIEEDFQRLQLKLGGCAYARDNPQQAWVREIRRDCQIPTSSTS